MSLTPLQNLVDELSIDLGAPILLEDNHSNMVVYSAGQEHLDEVRTASILRRQVPPDVAAWVRQQGVFEATAPVRVRLPATVAPHHLGRIAVPVRNGVRRLGTLWIVDDAERLGPSELLVAERSAAQAALLLYEEELADRLGSRLMSHLLSPVAELRLEAAEQLEMNDRAPPFVVAVLRRRDSGQPTASMENLAQVAALRRHLARPLILAQADAIVVLVSAAPSSPSQDAFDRALTAVERADEAGSGTWVGGISDVHAELDEAPLAHRHANLASRIAELQPASTVMSWRTLGALRILIQIPRQSRGDAIDERVRPLFDVSSTTIRHTVEEFLDQGGDIRRTAQRLSIHRGTVYNRLRRVEAITGLDLERGDDRLTLHVSLVAQRLWPNTGPSGGHDVEQRQANHALLPP